ncbi:hypothetical protein [Clostridium arbusti]|uniref:hypothetical protein n=1 Tax=Clostridium arbusti TaxID=1137848 RepID=UPI00028A1374|nr:hypothetical protein [Clostridium arbusti]
MDKTEFSKLSIENQVKYINDNMKIYGSATKVIEAIGYSESTIRKKLNKHGYHMNSDKTAYVLDNNSETKVNDNSESKNINDSETKVINKNDSLMIEKINTFTKEIQKFNSLKDEMLEMLEWYKIQKKNENVIDVSDPKINIDIERIGTEKAITKGIKLYIKIYDEFKNFAGNHKEYKLQDLTAMALIEYMEKYK